MGVIIMIAEVLHGTLRAPIASSPSISLQPVRPARNLRSDSSSTAAK